MLRWRDIPAAAWREERRKTVSEDRERNKNNLFPPLLPQDEKKRRLEKAAITACLFQSLLFFLPTFKPRHVSAKLCLAVTI
jgi:hypothetical protein